MTHSTNLQYSDAYRHLASALINDSVADLNDLDEMMRCQIAWLSVYNQLLLALVQDAVFDFSMDTDLMARIERLNLLEIETSQVVSDMLPQFEEAQRPLLAIKSFLPFAYVDTNLDLVTVHPDQWASYVDDLCQLGYRQFRNLADLREPMKATFFKPGIDLKIHLHSAVSWNGLMYLPLAPVLQRKRLIEINGYPVAIPSAEDEMLIMAAHACFENKYVSLHEVLYWHHLVNLDLDWDYMAKTAVTFNWYHGFFTFQSIISELANLLNIGVAVPIQSLPVSLTEEVWFPYILPIKQTVSVTGSKLKQDIQAKQWRQLPRELFSFTFVDGLWMYRKAYRKRQKVLQICS